MDHQALEPLPPATLIGRVVGSEDVAPFAASGQRTVDEWARTLRLVEKTFRDFPRIVDFGCGCGRALRHLKPKLKSTQELIGIDVDGEAIDWISANYPGINAFKLGLLPPSPIDADTVDLVVNHSVFTHLPEDVQFAWLAELHRIVKTGGFLILTIHGRKVANEYNRNLLESGRISDAEAFIKHYNDHGFFHVKGRSALEEKLPEYYGAAFHTIEYIEANWLRWFRCRAWLPVAALDHQDVLLLEKV